MYFIWFLINSILVISIAVSLFVYYSTKNESLKSKLKPLAYFFTAIIIAIIFFNDYKDEDATKVKTIIVNEIPKEFKIGAENSTERFLLLDALQFDINLNITSVKKNGDKIPLQGFSTLQGFNGGFKWNLTALTVEENKNGEIEYHAMGTLDWKFLGIRMYTELKEFRGVLNYI